MRQMESVVALNRSLMLAFKTQNIRSVSCIRHGILLDPYETDLTPGLECYYGRGMYLDFNASYKWLHALRLYAEINNLLNQPMRNYAGDPDRTCPMEYDNRRFNAA